MEELSEQLWKESSFKDLEEVLYLEYDRLLALEGGDRGGSGCDCNGVNGNDSVGVGGSSCNGRCDGPGRSGERDRSELGRSGERDRSELDQHSNPDQCYKRDGYNEYGQCDGSDHCNGSTSFNNSNQLDSYPSNHNQLDSHPSNNLNPSNAPTVSPTLQDTNNSSNTIQDSLLSPPLDPNSHTNKDLSLSDLVPSAISIQDLTVSIQDVSINGSPVNRRLSSSSMASLDEGPVPTFPTYTEKELANLLRKLHNVVESHLKDHPYAMLPSRYQSIIDKLCCEAATTHYLDTLSLSILSSLLKCMAVRLFQFIQHAYYDRFVGTDLFEYLVSEQCFPSSSIFSPRLLRASMYAVDRLKDCEEEIPYLRKFIQEYSQNALELMEPSVVHSPSLTCRQRKISRKELSRRLSRARRKRGRIETGRTHGPFAPWTWKTLSATLVATNHTASINSVLRRIPSI